MPLGEKTADVRGSVCLAKVVKHFPEVAVQSLAVLSADAVITEFPSGEKEADLTSSS